MKVTDFRTMVVENEPPYIGGRYLLWLELHTDEGISGLGERITGSTYSRRLGDLKSQISLIEEMVEQYVVGENPFNIEKIWDRMYASRHDYRHPSLHATPVLSAIDMALWDIAGKAAGQPIYNLLGGKYHETLRAYAYMPGGSFKDNPEAAGEVAAQLLEEGNSACKIDPFMPTYPIPRDISLPEIEHAAKIFESIRDAVGNKLEVGIGTHGQLTTYSAIRVAKILEPYHPILVRGACAAGEHRRDGAGGSAHEHSYRKRGAAGYEVRVLATHREEGCADYSAGCRAVWGHIRGKEDSGDRGGALRDDRAAHVLRANRRCGCNTDRHLLAELPDTGGEPGTAAQDYLQRADCVRERGDHSADWSGAGN